MPEPLSGLPEPAAIEIRPGRPWLSVNETNRLLRRHGVDAALARAFVLDEVVQGVSLSEAEENAEVRAWLKRRGVKDDNAATVWLRRQGLDTDDLRMIATRATRLRRFRDARWADVVEAQFLRRKLELDRVVYSLLQLPEREVAEELHARLQEGETDFVALAADHSLGAERESGGLIGPVPLASPDPALVARLRVGTPGQLWPPFAVGGRWLVLRLEQRLPARLDDATRVRLLNELFEAWVDERVKLLRRGEPLPSVAPDLALLEAPPRP